MLRYRKYYSADALWKKLSRCASVAGRQVVETALVLYYCLRDGDTPARVRAVIIGALGYLIFPADLISDFLPGIGFTDDLAALVAAVTMLAAYVKPRHQAAARRVVGQWFSPQSAE